MKNWLARIIHPDRESAALVAGAAASSDASASTDAASSSNDGEVTLLQLQKETQALRMELDAREQSITALKQEIERLRLRQDQLVAETVASRLGGLFNDLAGPASQILTQADLLERQDRPVQARDVLSVARRMVRALERYGVSFDGQAGEQVTFDPNRHTPAGGAALSSGKVVTVRFAGVLYQGKVIYKAIVE